MKSNRRGYMRRSLDSYVLLPFLGTAVQVRNNVVGYITDKQKFKSLERKKG